MTIEQGVLDALAMAKGHLENAYNAYEKGDIEKFRDEIKGAEEEVRLAKSWQ